MRSTRFFAALAVAFLLLAACKQQATTGGGGGKTADSIVIGTTDSLQNSFDPAQAYDFFGFNIVGQVAETLVTYAPNATTPSPLLAKKLPEVSADGLKYTFELKEAKFHDGTDLDSAAVKFSLERARDFGAKDAEAAGFLLSGITTIDTPSKSTVVITLKSPDVAFLAKLAYTVASIVSPTAYKNNVLSGTEDKPTVLTKYKTDTLVGTGHYKLISYKEKESLELEAFDDYWGDKAKTDKVLIRLFDKSSALKLALQNEDIDVAFRALQPDELSFFEKRDGFKVVKGEGPGIRYIVFNVNTKPWDNVNMRKAVAAAVDRKQVVDDVLKGTGETLEAMVPPPFKTTEDLWADLYGSKPDKTKVDQFLTAAGVPAGQKVDVNLWFSPTHYGDTESAFAQVVGRQLEATGRFTVKIDNVEWAEYGDKRRAGEMPVFLMGWYPDYIDEDDYLAPFADINIFDPAKWNDPTMLGKVAAQVRELDAGKRATLIKDAHKYMAEQTPYVPIYQITQYAATTDNVSGVVLDPIQILRYWLIEKKT